MKSKADPDVKANPSTSKRKKWEPSGTPWQRDCRLKDIAKSLRRSAKAYRREADKAEKLADRIETDRLAGQSISQHQLVDAFDLSEHAHYSICKLAGTERWHQRREFIHALYPQVYPQMQKPEAAVAREAVAAVDIASADVLAQATAVARSVAGEEIDWSREPLTERERKIRKRFLENALRHRDGPESVAGLCDLSITRLDLLRKQKMPASDLREALEERDRRFAADRETESISRYREIADELDDEAA
jgi:hypothetical protein